jgi:hypothetical protein
MRRKLLGSFRSPNSELRGLLLFYFNLLFGASSIRDGLIANTYRFLEMRGDFMQTTYARTSILSGAIFSLALSESYLYCFNSSATNTRASPSPYFCI